jgi:glycosyltransferase involved in cell wall biosynthesis
LTSNKWNLLVAIPALNEEATIEAIIYQVRKAAPDAAILVIDDGSTDNTFNISSRHADFVISHSFNLGVGAAMRTAFRFAKYNDFMSLIQFDADGQHSPDSIPQIFEALKSSDVVIGSRFLGATTYQLEKTRILAIRFLSFILRVGSHIKISDPTSGNRGASFRAIELFADTYPTEYLGDTLGSLIISSKEGLVIREIPVIMNSRQGGEASQAFLSSMKHFVRIVLVSLLMFLTWNSNNRRER